MLSQNMSACARISDQKAGVIIEGHAFMYIHSRFRQTHLTMVSDYKVGHRIHALTIATIFSNEGILVYSRSEEWQILTANISMSIENNET